MLSKGDSHSTFHGGSHGCIEAALEAGKGRLAHSRGFTHSSPGFRWKSLETPLPITLSSEVSSQ